MYVVLSESCQAFGTYEEKNTEANIVLITMKKNYIVNTQNELICITICSSI